jgi:hypothetical protein
LFVGWVQPPQTGHFGQRRTLPDGNKSNSRSLGDVLKKNLRLTLNGNNAIENANPPVLITKREGGFSPFQWKKWNHLYLRPFASHTSQADSALN